MIKALKSHRGINECLVDLKLACEILLLFISIHWYNFFLGAFFILTFFFNIIPSKGFFSLILHIF